MVVSKHLLPRETSKAKSTLRPKLVGKTLVFHGKIKPTKCTVDTKNNEKKVEQWDDVSFVKNGQKRQTMDGRRSLILFLHP